MSVGNQEVVYLITKFLQYTEERRNIGTFGLCSGYERDEKDSEGIQGGNVAYLDSCLLDHLFRHFFAVHSPSYAENEGEEKDCDRGDEDEDETKSWHCLNFYRQC